MGFNPKAMRYDVNKGNHWALTPPNANIVAGLSPYVSAQDKEDAEMEADMEYIEAYEEAKTLSEQIFGGNFDEGQIQNNQQARELAEQYEVVVVPKNGGFPQGPFTNPFYHDPTEETRYKETKKRVARARAEKHKRRIESDYLRCFEAWTLGKNKLLNDRRITNWGYETLAGRFPRIPNFALQLVESTRLVHNYLFGLYMRGPQSEREIEVYFKYLVWPVQEALRKLQVLNGNDNLTLDDLHAGPTGVLVANFKAPRAKFHYRVKQGQYNRMDLKYKEFWPRDLVFLGFGRKEGNKVPLNLDPTINRFMRPGVINAVSYKEWCDGDYSALSPDVRELWELTNERMEGRDDRNARPGAAEDTFAIPSVGASKESLQPIENAAVGLQWPQATDKVGRVARSNRVKGGEVCRPVLGRSRKACLSNNVQPSAANPALVGASASASSSSIANVRAAAPPADSGSAPRSHIDGGDHPASSGDEEMRSADDESFESESTDDVLPTRPDGLPSVPLGSSSNIPKSIAEDAQLHRPRRDPVTGKRLGTPTEADKWLDENEPNYGEKELAERAAAAQKQKEAVQQIVNNPPTNPLITQPTNPPLTMPVRGVNKPREPVKPSTVQSASGRDDVAELTREASESRTISPDEAQKLLAATKKNWPNASENDIYRTMADKAGVSVAEIHRSLDSASAAATSSTRQPAKQPEEALAAEIAADVRAIDKLELMPPPDTQPRNADGTFAALKPAINASETHAARKAPWSGIKKAAKTSMASKEKVNKYLNSKGLAAVKVKKADDRSDRIEEKKSKTAKVYAGQKAASPQRAIHIGAQSITPETFSSGRSANERSKDERAKKVRERAGAKRAEVVAEKEKQEVIAKFQKEKATKPKTKKQPSTNIRTQPKRAAKAVAKGVITKATNASTDKKQKKSTLKAVRGQPKLAAHVAKAMGITETEEEKKKKKEEEEEKKKKKKDDASQSPM